MVVEKGKLLGRVRAQIHLGRLEAGMTQPKGDLADIACGLQRACGAAVPQHKLFFNLALKNIHMEYDSPCVKVVTLNLSARCAALNARHIEEPIRLCQAPCPRRSLCRIDTLERS